MWRVRHHGHGRKWRQVETLSRQTRRMGLFLGLLLSGVFGAIGWVVISNQQRASASDNLPEIAVGAGSDFVYDLAQLQPSQTRFFTYPISSSEKARLLIHREADGEVRATFASCTPCYASRGEHRLYEGKLVCGRCEHAMRLGKQNESGLNNKCVAVPVRFSKESEKVIVRAQAVIEGLQVIAGSKRARPTGVQ